MQARCRLAASSSSRLAWDVHDTWLHAGQRPRTVSASRVSPCCGISAMDITAASRISASCRC